MTQKLHVAYGDIYMDWQLGRGDGSHPTNPIRALLVRDLLKERLGASFNSIKPVRRNHEDEDIAAIKTIHDAEYVDHVLAGDSDEWVGNRPNVARAGLAMFSGTMRLVEKMLAGRAKVAFNPQGAKHHARANRSSGFCVFNDFAWAAIQFKNAGFVPLYIDWDIHAGDGVYHLLRSRGIATISIHNSSIYPSDREMQTFADENGELHHPDELAYNFNVAPGSGDEAFKWAIDGACEIIEQIKPTVILLAAGADGHEGQGNLGEINRFTDAGYKYAAEKLGALVKKYCDGRILIGGAGGYQPLKETPETWALVVETIYNLNKKGN